MPRCKLDNCPIAADGRCLEGRGVDCPNLIPDVDEVDSVAESPKPPPPGDSIPSEMEKLYGALPLDVGEARRFVRRGPCMVVVLSGMPECGKTSLLARLHQLFQAGPVGEFEFAGSQSLPLLEELNWLATVESGVTTPVMKRSSTQFDNSFIHLAVRSIECSVKIELLINDITGETFEHSVAARQNCEKLVAIARADHLVVLVDGEALAVPGSRYHHIAQTRDFVDRVLETGQCGEQTGLHIVVSKLDKLHSQEAVADEMEKEFASRFRPTVGSLDFWRIAARPMDGSLPTKQKIVELFSSWVRTTHRYPTPTLPIVERKAWARDFCRYGI